MRFILIFVILFNNCFAYGADPATKEIINESTKAAFRAGVEHYAKETIDTFIAKQLGKEVTKKAAEEGGKKASEKAGDSYVGTALSLYGMYSAVGDFDKARSNSQRHYAAADFAANVVSLVFPAVGWIAQLIVLGAKLLGAGVSSYYAKTIAQLYKETSQLILERAEIQKSIIESEKVFYTETFEQLLIIEDLSKEITKAQEEQCYQLDLRNSPENLFRCIGYLELKRDLIVYYLEGANRMLNNASIYITRERFMELANIDSVKFEKSLAKTAEDAKIISETLKATQEKLVDVVKESYALQIQNSDEVERNKKRLECRKVDRDYDSNLKQLLLKAHNWKNKKNIAELLYVDAKLDALENEHTYKRIHVCETERVESPLQAQIKQLILEQARVL